ncbi:ABC transporter ATP-binding protein [Sphingobium aquiterrae]|uniref:ABC transporter ATP-binding protein n=1 Tax=Sphingobium aquiterrae TaxID=2038656 RepID=UPI00301AB295
MSDVYVEKLSKRFGDVTALHGVDLHVAEGEFLTLLGPSGCGKSTTLFAIAGLDRPTGGTIRVGSNVFFDAGRGIDVPPEHRNLGLVFQSYALWPHMSVRQNLAFPLKLRGVGKAEQASRIAEALSLVDMEDYADRLPHELSGGQQQRVALARTLVFRPTLLLLDEPLSNLDAKLRIKARGWLKQLQRQLGLTTIYVTHDQEEALALSDRIAVMERGRIAQLDRPEVIYTRPANAFVADFVGASNFLPVETKGRSAEFFQVLFEGQGLLSAVATTAGECGSSAMLTVRPQYIRLSRQRPEANGSNILEGRIVERTYLGARHAYAIAIGGHSLIAEAEDVLEPGPVFASFAPKDTLLVSA